MSPESEHAEARLSAFRESSLRRADDLGEGAIDGWPRLAGVVGILFASRSGSTALSRHIGSTYEVGKVREAFNTPAIRSRMKRHSLEPFPALSRFIEENAPSGWFVFKAGAPGIINAERLRFITAHHSRFFGALLLRRDLIAQAISIDTARRTGQYHSTQEAEVELTADDFQPDGIWRRMQTIDRIVRSLDAYLSLLDRPRCTLVYEDFKGGDYSVVSAALSGLNIPVHASHQPDEQVRPVTRSYTADWKQKMQAALSPSQSEMLASYERFVDDTRQRWPRFM